MRHLLQATDPSDRLLAAGALALGAGLGWLLHPAWLVIVVGVALIAAGVLRDLGARLTEAE